MKKSVLLGMALCTILSLQAMPRVSVGQEAAASDENLSQPGKEHAQFKRLAGEWNCMVKAYYGDPENPSMSQGTATFRVLLGGRYLQQVFEGAFGDTKFRGIGISGYDRVKKQYVGTWMDSMSTSMMHMTGSYDVASHTLTETAAAPDGNGTIKMVTKYIDKEKFEFTMYMVPADGEPVKSLEITYQRKAS